MDLVGYIFEDKLTLGLGILILVLCWTFLSNRKKNQPPGPWLKLPIVGSLPFIRPVAPMYECVMRLKKKYGDIFSLNIGRDLVILTSYEHVKEGFQKQGDVLSGRPHDNGRETIGNRGILLADGPIWRAQRRFALATLRDFGMGKISAENNIVLEAENLITELMKYANKPINMQMTLGITTSNVICDLVFGRRYDYDDPQCQIYIKAFTENASSRRTLKDRLPKVLRPFFFFLQDSEAKRSKNREKISKIVNEIIDEHKKTFNKDVIRDFIDAYLSEMESRKEGDQESYTFDEYQMFRTIFDLFIAGTETTSTTLRWAILYLCFYPEIQKKVQAEIDEYIEKGGYPKMSDKQNMPFTEAVLLEIQRIAVLVPLVPHRATENMEIGGYKIYKDTTVIAALWALLRDPKVWPEPDKFDPGHFLDENGKVINREHLVTFSIGKRVCAGESLAKMELFIFFVTMLQRFSFSLPKDEKISLKDSVTGTVRMPKPYNVILTPR